ncbi:hypothetical protein M0R45_016951 [Rubus argutus]|uniref:Ribosomal protein L5 n=1 Tax=Rubus argutus TaxID=59490 RepID=A0AAW1XU54_RUBAR
MARNSGLLLRHLLGNHSKPSLLNHYKLSPNLIQTLTLNSIPSAPHSIPSSSKSFSTFPLDFHYEDVLRQDMLLKMNYDNVMQVPRLCELKVLSKAPEIGKIAMEISGGQKFLTQKDKDLTAKGFRGGANKEVSHRARQTTLRRSGMSNFLVRSLTVMSLLSSPVQIRKNFIQFTMETEFIESSPELEDHFEIFEQIKGFNVTIVTSANTKDEAVLLWSGFLQKDEDSYIDAENITLFVYLKLQGCSGVVVERLVVVSFAGFRRCRLLALMRSEPENQGGDDLTRSAAAVEMLGQKDKFTMASWESEKLDGIEK